MAVVVDSSLWIDYLAGRAPVEIYQLAAGADVILPPLVVAELLAGENTPQQRAMIGELLQEFPLHATPLGHWMAVGELRRMLRNHGINATIPDAHIAQCALDLGATLLTGDEIFTSIARHTRLRVAQLR